GYTFRFGPGRQSRRLQQIERLRELRVRHSAAGLAHDLAHGAPLSRGSTRGGKQFSKERKGDDTAYTSSRDRKRRRESSGEANQIERQRLSPKNSLAATTHFTPYQQQQHEAPPPGLTIKVAHNVVEDPTRGRHDHAKGARGGWSRDDPGLNSNLTKISHSLGPAKYDGIRTRLDVSTAPKDPLGSLDEGDEGRRAYMGSAFFPGSDSPLSKPASAPIILPIRSGPALWRPRAGSSQRPIPSSENRCQQQQHSCKHNEHNSVAGVTAAAAAAAAAAALGGKDSHGRASSKAGSNAGAMDGGSSAGNEGNVGTELPVGFSVESGSGHPALADSCGGIVLRLSPAERSLEPWSTTLAPLRAMCDIDPSLSRAGIDYRSVMHAVEGAQEMKSLHTVKQKKAREAKSLLGQDVRPRTSEPRL
ncbi:unnamed protein product, partial [Pylaiella littoralis]